MRSPIYLDHAATTPVDERVLDTMLPFLQESYGNAASRTHVFGRIAEAAVAKARERVASLINAEPKEIIWTSGATEANNAAIFGVARRCPDGKSHIIIQATEHPAVLDPIHELERQGFAVSILPVNADGCVTAQAVQAAIHPETAMVSIMTANNETGVLQPVNEIGSLCRKASVLFHTDATQAAGKIPLDVDRDHIDLMSFSAHKIYGPKGVGCLYVRSKAPRVRLRPLIFGGGHERGMRSGTINVPGVVGFGEACELAKQRISEDSRKLRDLRDHLEQGVCSRLEAVHINGDRNLRLPNISNIRFDHVEAESLLMMMEEVAASTGSACSTMKMEPSHVLRAMGLDEQQAFGSVRFSLGRENTYKQIEDAIERVCTEVVKLRQLNPFLA